MKIALPQGPAAKRVLAMVAAAAAVAAVVAGREAPERASRDAPAPRAAQVETPAARAEARLPEGDIDLAKLQRHAAAAPQSDPFAQRSFAPRQAQAAAAAPVPTPAAPPLPFSYIGKLTQDGRTEVYVMRGDNLISIAAHQEIDGEYRVEAITESSIAFTYLPLKSRQSLQLPEASG